MSSDAARTVIVRDDRGHLDYPSVPAPDRVPTSPRCSASARSTAGVLVRRGFADPDEARAFLAGEPLPHDPFLLGDMAGRATRSGRRSPRTGDLRARRLRRRRHLRHGDRGAVLRELGAEVEWHLPSRFDEGYGLRGDARATRRRGLRARADRRLRHHSRRRGTARARARARRDRHRPSPARRRAARLSDRRDAPVGLSVSRSLRHRRGLQARPGPARSRLRRAPPPPRPRRACDDRRRRPARRREPVSRDRGAAHARAHAEARTAGAAEVGARRSGGRGCRQGRLPARAAHQRLRGGSVIRALPSSCS